MNKEYKRLRKLAKEVRRRERKKLAKLPKGKVNRYGTRLVIARIDAFLKEQPAVAIKTGDDFTIVTIKVTGAVFVGASRRSDKDEPSDTVGVDVAFCRAMRGAIRMQTTISP